MSGYDWMIALFTNYSHPYLSFPLRIFVKSNRLAQQYHADKLPCQPIGAMMRAHAHEDDRGINCAQPKPAPKSTQRSQGHVLHVATPNHSQRGSHQEQTPIKNQGSIEEMVNSSWSELVQRNWPANCRYEIPLKILGGLSLVQATILGFD